MKRVLLTTAHPATYINSWVQILQRHYAISVVYHKRESLYKKWNNLEPVAGTYLDTLSLSALLGLVRKHDLVILGGWNKWILLAVIFLKPFYKAKMAVFSDYPQFDGRRSLSYYFKKYFIFKAVDYIFCATESTGQFYAQEYGIQSDKIKFFPYEFDKATGEDIDGINAQRESALKGGQEKLRIFVANSFIARKGYATIVQALEKLKSDGKTDRFDMLVAGGGELKEEVTRQILAIKPDVQFVGWLETDQYQDILKKSDVFLHASTFEPFGIPPLDAMCRGKLVICSDGVKSVSSLIENGISGYLFPAGDAEALYAILRDLDLTRVYAIGKEGRDAVRTAYRDTIYTDTIESCLGK